jgi:hypothetical protein
MDMDGVVRSHVCTFSSQLGIVNSMNDITLYLEGVNYSLNQLNLN